MSLINNSAYETAVQRLTGKVFDKRLSEYKEKEKQQAEALDAARAVADDPSKQNSKVREVAEDFVSIFMAQIMKSMRATVNENSFMHGGNGEKYFQEMNDQEYAKLAAKGSGYGLTDLVYQALANKAKINPDKPAANDNLAEITGSGEEAQ